MKRKKLDLSRETVRALDKQHLLPIAAAVVRHTDPGTGPTVDSCFWSCGSYIC